VRRARCRLSGTDHPGGSHRGRDRAARHVALRDGRGSRFLRAPGLGAGRSRHGVSAEGNRKLRLLRLPRPQSHHGGQIERTRSCQRARHSLAPTQGWPRRTADRSGRGIGVSGRHESRGLQSFYDCAWPGLRRISRGSYPYRSHRTARWISALPMGFTRRGADLCVAVGGSAIPGGCRGLIGFYTAAAAPSVCGRRRARRIPARRKFLPDESRP